MVKFADNLKVAFFINHFIVQKDKSFEYSKLENDSSLYLDLNNQKDTNILHLLTTSKKIHLQGKVYIVEDYEFMTDGTALFIHLSVPEKENNE